MLWSLLFLLLAPCCLIAHCTHLNPLVSSMLASSPFLSCALLSVFKGNMVEDIPRVMTHGKQMNYLIIQHSTFKTLVFICERRVIKHFKSSTSLLIPFLVPLHTVHP